MRQSTQLVPHASTTATARDLLSRCLRGGGGARRRARATSAPWARALALMAPPILLVGVALAVLATPLTVSSRLAPWISCCVTRTRRRASRCGRQRLRPIDWLRFWNNSASRTRYRCRCTARSGRGYCFCFGFLHSHIRNRNSELQRKKTRLGKYKKEVRRSKVHLFLFFVREDHEVLAKNGVALAITTLVRVRVGGGSGICGSWSDGRSRSGGRRCFLREWLWVGCSLGARALRPAHHPTPDLLLELTEH